MNAAIDVQGLAVLRGGAALLYDISFRLERGEALAIVGPSGAGKSTLLRAVLGLTRFQRGSIRLEGRDLRRLGPRERARQLAWLPQIDTLWEPMAVIDLLRSARFRFDETDAAATQVALAVLDRCGIGQLADRRATSLSGGERQRLAVATLLAQEAQSLVLDEPSNHLDLRRQRELYALLGREWHAGTGLLLATHDVNLLTALDADGGQRPVRLLALREGRCVWLGTLGDEDLAERLSDLYDLALQSVTVDGQRYLLPREGAP